MLKKLNIKYIMSTNEIFGNGNYEGMNNMLLTMPSSIAQGYSMINTLPQSKNVINTNKNQNDYFVSTVNPSYGDVYLQFKEELKNRNIIGVPKYHNDYSSTNELLSNFMKISKNDEKIIVFWLSFVKILKFGSYYLNFL